MANLESQHTKSNGHSDCGTKYGISFHKTIKIGGDHTTHMRHVCVYILWSSILLAGDPYLHRCMGLLLHPYLTESTSSHLITEVIIFMMWITSREAGGWRPLLTSSLRPTAAVKRISWKNKCRSQSQWACLCDPLVQATGHNSPLPEVQSAPCPSALIMVWCPEELSPSICSMPSEPRSCPLTTCSMSSKLQGCPHRPRLGCQTVHTLQHCHANHWGVDKDTKHVDARSSHNCLHLQARCVYSPEGLRFGSLDPWYTHLPAMLLCACWFYPQWVCHQWGTW